MWNIQLVCFSNGSPLFGFPKAFRLEHSNSNFIHVESLPTIQRRIWPPIKAKFRVFSEYRSSLELLAQPWCLVFKPFLYLEGFLRAWRISWKIKRKESPSVCKQTRLTVVKIGSFDERVGLNDYLTWPLVQVLNSMCNLYLALLNCSTKLAY